ncbi:MAG: branched-chain amino acid transport system permease protein [Acidobacteriota bacterium]|jgi:branched-chain amino acid transport system permease protein|nr:branched-chain amino acid transport system permease protein [Acidobacteriota bacterium]
MAYYTQQILNALALGFSYALLALGYNLTFGVLRSVNLAYGEVFTVAAYAVVMASTWGVRMTWLLLLFGLLASAISGLIIHFVAVKPLGDVTGFNSARHLAVLVSTMGCSIAIHNAIVVFVGGYPRRFPPLISAGSGGVGMGNLGMAVTISLSVMVLLTIVLRKTRFGLRLRAMAENRELALMSGVNARRNEVACVILSSALAGLSGILTAQGLGAISPFMGGVYGLKALVAIIVGGPGNMFGAVIVSLLLGLSEVLAVVFFASSYRDAVSFGLLIALILGRRFIAAWRT